MTVTSTSVRSTSDDLIIAGAGIGGLATALALSRHGIASRVFEQRAQPPDEGAGIQVGSNGVHVLRWLGVANALQPLSAAPVSLRIMDALSGRELAALPLGSTIEMRHGAPYWCLHRADLHRVLFAAAAAEPLISLVLGVGVDSALADDDCVNLQLSDGTALRGAALIGADGLWSRARLQVSPVAKVRFSGARAFRAVIPAQDLPTDLSPASTHIWLSPDAHVVHYPVSGGRDIAIVAVCADPDETGDVTPDKISDRFATSATPLRQLLMQPRDWRAWPLMDMPERSPRHRGRIALIGDAAQPILPYLAQGGVMALEDAVTIAAQMARATTIPEAFAAYAGEREARVARVARAASRNGWIYHLRGVAALARNGVLKAAPGGKLLAAYDWLYGWRIDAGGEH